MNTESLDGIKSVHSARRGVKRDALVSGKRVNAADGPICPTEGWVSMTLGPLEIVAFPLWRAAPRRGSHLASDHGNPVKRFRIL